MTPDERKTMLSLIDDHHAAMRAQVDDPGVRLEWLDGDVWKPSDLTLCSHVRGPFDRIWHRLAPAPRLVPLDQSDFLGPNRVTHLKPNANPEHTYAVVHCSDNLVSFGGGTSTSYRTLRGGWQCSRDNGATFQPCSKIAP